MKLKTLFDLWTGQFFCGYVIDMRSICFRVFKKVSPNQKLTLYLASRDLVVSAEGIDRIVGVLLVDPEFVEDRKVYGQITLTFR